ncbi:ribonuclease H1-like isoform X2 [Saccostrea echinata]|uniref:ribonuclease H1-like isoform X2 n=1 Tax=Saccostrea echinata TaxID=191078 RepID=UPI002A83750E|nr:ribonuclease H1-like isoform X2 [Saccostrea echinata]
MGSIMGKAMDENLKKNQEFMLKVNQLTLERQIQMQNQMRERQMAMMVARGRDIFQWFGAFYGTYASIAILATMKTKGKSKGLIAPLLPLTFILGYQYDLAYGSKMERMRQEADRVLDTESYLLDLPHGLPTFKSIEAGRLKAKDASRVNQGHDIFLDSCKEQVHGYSGARYKKFSTAAEAQAFVDGSDSGGSSSYCRGYSSYSGGYSSYSSSGNSGSSSTETEDDHVYTDGCCRNNGQKGSVAGIGVYWGPDHPCNVSEKLPGRPTNNRAEIHAARVAVKQAKERKMRSVTVVTDSQFLINGMTSWIHSWKKNGWTLSDKSKVKNVEDWKALDAEMKDINVKFKHVRGHTGVDGNEEADRLANEGAMKNASRTGKSWF